MARLDPSTGLYRCPGCRQEKLMGEYYTCESGRMDTYCRECSKMRAADYVRRHGRRRNGESARRSEAKYKAANRAAIRAKASTLLSRLLRWRRYARGRLAATTDPAAMARYAARIDQLTEMIERHRTDREAAK